MKIKVELQEEYINKKLDKKNYCISVDKPYYSGTYLILTEEEFEELKKQINNFKV